MNVLIEVNIYADVPAFFNILADFVCFYLQTHKAQNKPKPLVYLKCVPFPTLLKIFLHKNDTI